ncbi:MAG: hypothetical protein IJ766_09495 [Clostridia bacterium]|nr:hypothetical protein [Clostridia bacterium]
MKMKRFAALLAALLLAVCGALPVFAQDATSAAAAEPKQHAVKLSCDKNTPSGDILYVTVALSGCSGLTSADLRFSYDTGVLTFLGASLLGACAGDENFIAAFSEADAAAANGYVGLSFFHTKQLSAEEGNGDLCELAFRTSDGKSVIKAAALSFMIGETAAKVSLGKCKYSSGMGYIFRQYGSMLLIAGVALVVIIVLVVLLVIINRLKKQAKIQTVLFEETDAAPDAENDAKAEAETADGEAANESVTAALPAETTETETAAPSEEDTHEEDQ